MPPSTHPQTSRRQTSTAQELSRGFLILGLLTVTAAAFSLVTGATAIGVEDLARAVTGRAPDEVRFILWELRFPRMLTSALVGAALGAAGALFQALLRNPLADPFVLGVSGGAAMGAVLVITLGVTWSFAPPVAAFLGALLATVLVYTAGRRADGVHPETMLLVGVIANAFFSAIIMFLMARADQSSLMRSNHWLMGHLSSAGLSNLAYLLPLTVLPALYVTTVANKIHLLQLGAETSWHLGVDVPKLQRGMFLASCLLTAGAVSASGLIGFVGLITPHIIRRAFSADFRVLFPLSFVGGAALVILSDTAARTILAPSELPVGVLTAALGAPFFLFLLRRRNG